MARTIQQIYDAIIDEKETQSSLNALVPNPDDAQTFLSDLTSSSKVAIWRMFMWIMAVAIWTHETLFDQHKVEIENRANELITGTLRWYRQSALLFQYGDQLQWNATSLKYEYPSGSTGSKIVSNASAIEVGDQVRIKIAKDDGSGGLEPLSSSEEISFTTYMNRIKFAGTNLAITNIQADQLKLEMRIFYDPLILDATGTLISDGTTKPVEKAIENYIQNLPFDGTYNLTKLIDAVQVATGVIDPELISSQARSGSSAFADTGQSYVADAGYLEIDPSFPLDDVNQIEYVAVTI